MLMMYPLFSPLLYARIFFPALAAAFRLMEEICAEMVSETAYMFS